MRFRKLSIDEIQHFKGRRFPRALSVAGGLAFSPSGEKTWATDAAVRVFVRDRFLHAKRQTDLSEPAQPGQARHGGAAKVGKPSSGAGCSDW